MRELLKAGNVTVPKRVQSNVSDPTPIGIPPNPSALGGSSALPPPAIGVVSYKASGFVNYDGPAARKSSINNPSLGPVSEVVGSLEPFNNSSSAPAPVQGRVIFDSSASGIGNTGLGGSGLGGGGLPALELPSLAGRRFP